MPRVSVVTPSFNQAEFIEETIRSVLLQDYPNLEYIIIDGGSNAETLQIIRKYEGYLAHWVSESDRGQCHAVNKGWRRATGDFVAFLASDDLYLPGAIEASVRYLLNHPHVGLVYAYAHHIDQTGQIFNRIRSPKFNLRRLIDSCFIVQPSVFFRRDLLDSVGYLDETLYCGMDYDYWLRAARTHEFGQLPMFTAAARYHAEAKSIVAYKEFFLADLRIFDRLFSTDRDLAHRPEVVRAAYIPRLIYILGRKSGCTDDEKTSALERLRAFGPPSVPEMVKAVASNDRMYDSPYLSPGARGTSAGHKDAFEIVPGLLDAGVIDKATAGKVIKQVEALAWVRDVERLAHVDPLIAQITLAKVAIARPAVVQTRPFWAAAARSSSLGRLLLRPYYVARGGPAFPLKAAARCALSLLRPVGSRVRSD